MRAVNPAVSLALFLLVQARAFAPLWVKNESSSTTSLYGLRTFLRRRLVGNAGNLGNADKREPTDVQGEPTSMDLSVHTQYDQPKATLSSSTASSRGSCSPNMTNFQIGFIEAELEPFETSTVVLVPPEIRDPADLEVAMVPPRNEEDLTRNEREFRQMLVEFSNFSAKDVEHIRDPRLRTVFQGVMASYHIPLAYRAFEVLFEDYAPLRIGGRLIYAQLKQAMDEAQKQRHEEVESLTAATGLSKEEIEDSRIAFLRMAVPDDDKTAKLSIQQLVDYGLAETVLEVLGYEDFDNWIDQNLNFTSTTEKVGFCELMVALQSCSADSSQPECNPATVLQEVASRIEPRQAMLQLDASTVCQKKIRYATRYNEMVDAFLEWKEFVPAGKRTRKMDVLHGCFAGAENERIVDALRIVYVDYSALRFAGDLVFKVMKAVVGGRMRQESPASQ